MIAYEDLVVALSSWRAAQGLPSNAVSFLEVDSGSVDLALPVAEPIEALGTAEVEAIDDDVEFAESASDEYAIADEYAVVEEYETQEQAPQDHEAENSALAAAAKDEDAQQGPATEHYADVESAEQDDSAGIEVLSSEEVYEASPAVEESNELNYADDESEQTAIASDFQDASTYEDEAADADGYDVAEEGNADVVDDLAGQDEDLEGPTRFGDMDRESTTMGIGIAEIKGPGPGSDE